MWIRRSKYKELQQNLANMRTTIEKINNDLEEAEAKYKAVCDGEKSVIRKGRELAVVMSLEDDNRREKTILEMRVEIESLEDELASMKQKYADEVQKRLNLVERMATNEESGRQEPTRIATHQSSNNETTKED